MRLSAGLCPDPLGKLLTELTENHSWISGVGDREGWKGKRELREMEDEMEAKQSWTWVGSIHGSGRVGRVRSQNYPSWVGRYGSGRMSKICNKHTIYMLEIRRL